MPIDVRWPFGDETSLAWRIRSKIVISVVGIASYITTRWLNQTVVYNREALYDVVENRTENRPLLTVSNHHSCLDEPVLWGMLRLKHLTWGNQVMRWTLAASDICFTKEWHSQFFSHGRTVPVVRGEGVYQRAMDFCLDKMNGGEWVHAYPEGKINVTHEPMRLKWGVGRLVAECDMDPLVLPFYHLGMDEFLPNVEPYVPKFGKRITVIIGEVMEFGDVRKALRAGSISKREARKIITDRIQDEFEKLRQKALPLHEKHLKGE